MLATTFSFLSTFSTAGVDSLTVTPPATVGCIRTKTLEVPSSTKYLPSLVTYYNINIHITNDNINIHITNYNINIHITK